MRATLLDLVCVIQACKHPSDVAEGKHDRAADLVKFYGCELGAQTKYDKKSGTSIVNGAHDTSKLCELLEVGGCKLLLPATFVSLLRRLSATRGRSATVDMFARGQRLHCARKGCAGGHLNN